MPSSYPYDYGATLMKIEAVSLSASHDGSCLLDSPQANGRPILRGVSAEIKKIVRPGQIQGQVVSILGPSGRGKTQLCRIIAGLNKPTSGRVTTNGNDRPVYAGEVGVVAQECPMFSHRTVLSNLQLAAKYKEKDTKQAYAKIMEMMMLFGLEEHIHQYPAQLSGGQRQRCAIVQQILCSDHFLLMDEPFSGLDIVNEDTTLQLILKVANTDGLNTILLVTHDVSAAVAVSDHIWMLGYEREPDGRAIPGAKIIHTYDLIEAGLCWEQWNPRTAARPVISEFVRQLKEDFYNL